jgi:pSer/pThr/pTyr-binding forkhead associated (FHA) protein
MSGTHFLLLHQAGKYRITDCNSTNGTFVNGQQLGPQGVELEDQAHILAGNTLFVFKIVQPPAPETERKPKNYDPVKASPGGTDNSI